MGPNPDPMLKPHIALSRAVLISFQLSNAGNLCVRHLGFTLGIRLGIKTSITLNITTSIRPSLPTPSLYPRCPVFVVTEQFCLPLVFGAYLSPRGILETASTIVHYALPKPLPRCRSLRCSLFSFPVKDAHPSCASKP